MDESFWNWPKHGPKRATKMTTQVGFLSEGEQWTKRWIKTSKNLINHEGVCYAKKDFNVAKHPEIDVPNLQMIKLMQTFKSNEYVKETFAWMHYYWYLTNEGIEFLRTYLNLPCDIVPATLKKSAKPLGRPMGEPHGDHPRPYEGRKPDATFSFTDEDFYKVATGKMNPQISFMSLLIQLHHEIKWALGNAYRRKFL